MPYLHHEVDEDLAHAHHRFDHLLAELRVRVRVLRLAVQEIQKVRDLSGDEVRLGERGGAVAVEDEIAVAVSGRIRVKDAPLAGVAGESVPHPIERLEVQDAHLVIGDFGRSPAVVTVPRALAGWLRTEGGVTLQGPGRPAVPVRQSLLQIHWNRDRVRRQVSGAGVVGDAGGTVFVPVKALLAPQIRVVLVLSVDVVRLVERNA